ncbi:MAG: SbcC/MukB-like Walker B domain-containing protein, partial [Acidobacteriota bacterium]
ELAPDALGAARGAADLETELERRGRRYEAALQESERIGDLESRTRERRRDLLAELADEIPAKDEHSRTADSERQPLSDALGQALRRAERSRADARFAEERATQAERSASSARAEADEALSALENQLAESAFADAEALRRAALDPDALDALAESLRQLDLELERQRTEHHRSEADLEEHDEASDALGLDLEDAKEADFLDSLRAAARDVRGRHQQDTQRKLSLQLELRGDQERRKERRHSENRLADLRQRRERAGRLAQLIGQKDGGKFRRFAQQLNLEQLLELANLRLERLAPRYGLARVEGSLDLQVIDRDMADELRPTSTLSGGESFLVSLALALALADLRRGQLRLGTLFLDEGFGSLDQDTLETALTTLEQLQAEQETQILIISHVGALQERIAHRIEVHKEGGGRSRLLLGLGDGVSAG